MNTKRQFLSNPKKYTSYDKLQSMSSQNDEKDFFIIIIITIITDSQLNIIGSRPSTPCFLS